MMSRRCGALVLLIMSSHLGAASVEKASRVSTHQPDLLKRQQQFETMTFRAANFDAMSLMTTHISCEATEPPEALATPDPLFGPSMAATQIAVSFIVGTDGRVHSPLMLESLGPSGDRIVLDAVRAWRYRPATCNGVPTEVEGKIAFSSR